MKKVKFMKTGMENFCCYIEPMEMEMKENNLTVIIGPNGVGKSTIFDSIAFSLYGETTKKLKSDDIVNNKINKNAHTWLEFFIDDEFYRIDRYVKHFKFGTTVCLRKGYDENNIIKKGQKEVKPEIERLLMPQKLFFNTKLFGQKVNSFFTDLEDSKQKEIFRKILNLDDYILYQKEANNRISNCQSILQKYKNDIEIKNGIITDSTNQIKIIKVKEEEFENDKLNEINNLKIKLDEFKRQLVNLKNQRNEFDIDLDNNLNKLNDLITNKTNKIETISDECDTKLAEISNKKNIKILELRETASSRIHEIERNKDKEILSLKDDFRNNIEKEIRDKIYELDVSLASSNNKITAIKTEGTLLKKEKEKFEENVINKKISVCPTCNQKIGPSEITNLKTHISEIENKLSKLREDYKNIIENKNNLSSKKHDLELKLEEKDKKLQNKILEISNNFHDEKIKLDERLESALNKLRNIVSSKEEEIKKSFFEKSKMLEFSIKKNREEKEEIEDLISERNDIDYNISQISHKIDLNKNEIKIVSERQFDKSQLIHLKDKLKNLNNEIKNVKDKIRIIQEDIEVLEFWKEGYSPRGIPSMLIDESIPFLNMKVAKYLDNICHGRYIVSFDTLSETKSGESRDKISINIFDVETHANQRKQLSGGQSRIVDIATILTLSDLQSNIQGVDFNILLFDEIFDSLDDTNINQVSKLLKMVSKDKAIFVISHKHIDQIEADKTLNFLS